MTYFKTSNIGAKSDKVLDKSDALQGLIECLCLHQVPWGFEYFFTFSVLPCWWHFSLFYSA